MVTVRIQNTVALVLLAFTYTYSAQETPSCYEPGECVQSLYLGSIGTNDMQECLDFCHDDTPDCNFFTFFEEYGICDAFANCDEFDALSCQYCYSGASDCNDIQCELDGQCMGTFEESLIAESYSDCLESCHADNECQWAVYNSDGQICTLLLDCSQVEDCSTCLSSQRFCYTELATTSVPTTTSSVSSLLGDLTKIVAIGGNSDSLYLYEVEVVDLQNPNSNCGFLADYPVEIASHTAAFLDGAIKSCGGIYHDASISQYKPFENCYDYDSSTDEWSQSASLLKPRIDMASSVTGGNWLISSGKLIEEHYVNETLSWDDLFLNDTEIWSEGASSFELGIATLPEAMSDHCQATINNTHLFFAYAYTNGHAYILDYDADVWTQVDDMPIRFDEDGDGYHTTMCGRINNSINGDEIVVAGDGYTHIFNLGTLEWRDGPHLLPEGHSYASAQLENTLVLAGGEARSDPSMNAIQIFDNENYEWLMLEQTLRLPRENFAIVAVPANFTECQ